jgi:hypothetical protein
LPSSNIANTDGANCKVLANIVSPPIRSACGKLTTQPTPIAPLLIKSSCISANLSLGKGQPPSLSTSSSVIFKITKLPLGFGVITKLSNTLSFNICNGVD